MVLSRIALTLGALSVMAINPHFGSADPLQFPPKDERQLIGHYTYEIPSNAWTSKLRQPLSSDDKRYALEFRENNKKKYRVVFLVQVEGAEEGCGKQYELCTDRIVAAIRLPHYAPNEAINLRCRLKGRTSSSNQAYFGFVKNSKTPGYFPPRLAWHVVFEEPSFEPVDGNSVECPLFGAD